MSSQPWLMLYDPVTGESKPYPSNADQYREVNKDVAWMIDPWTGEKRTAQEIGVDVFGKNISRKENSELEQEFAEMVFFLTKNFTTEPKSPIFKEVWKTDIIESERGWGQKIDSTKIFDSKDEADKFVKEFNSRNTEDSAPDWYMYATTPRKEFKEV